MKKKTILILLFVACAPLIYLYFTQKLHTELLETKRISKLNSSDYIHIKEKTDAVILLTTMRSGSSIVGSIFDERRNVTYLYEPLFPFGDSGCGDVVREKVLSLLHDASTCHFENFKALYEDSNRFDRYR